MEEVGREQRRILCPLREQPAAHDELVWHGNVDASAWSCREVLCLLSPHCLRGLPMRCGLSRSFKNPMSPGREPGTKSCSLKRLLSFPGKGKSFCSQRRQKQPFSSELGLFSRLPANTLCFSTADKCIKGEHIAFRGQVATLPKCCLHVSVNQERCSKPILSQYYFSFLSPTQHLNEQRA